MRLAGQAIQEVLRFTAAGRVTCYAIHYDTLRDAGLGY